MKISALDRSKRADYIYIVHKKSWRLLYIGNEVKE